MVVPFAKAVGAVQISCLHQRHHEESEQPTLRTVDHEHIGKTGACHSQLCPHPIFPSLLHIETVHVSKAHTRKASGDRVVAGG